MSSVRDYYAILIPSVVFFVIGSIIFAFISCENEESQPIIDRYYCAYNWSDGNGTFGWGSATISLIVNNCCVQDSLAAIIERSDSSDEIVLVNFIKLEND